MDAVFEQPVETDKYWVDDKQRAAEVLQADKLWIEVRQSDQLAEVQRIYVKPPESAAAGETKMGDGPPDRYWTESRHPDRQWTVDRHTQRQIDRKMEKQWMGGRQIERSWSENRSVDFPIDGQWSEGRHVNWRTERQVQPLQLAQRPLLTFPSDGTPSPKQETDQLRGMEAPPLTWHQEEMQEDGQPCPDATAGFTEGWRSSGWGGGGGAGGGAVTCASTPDPPQQSGKPNPPKLRPRHRKESSDSHPGTSLSSSVCATALK